MKFLAANFITKVAQVFDDFWSYFEKHHFLLIMRLLLFGQLWWKIGLLFVLTSGHTGSTKARFGQTMLASFLNWPFPTLFVLFSFVSSNRAEI